MFTMTASPIVGCACSCSRCLAVLGAALGAELEAVLHCWVQYCRTDQRSLPRDQAHRAAVDGHLQSQLLGIFDGRALCLAMPLQPAIGEQKLQALHLHAGGGEKLCDSVLPRYLQAHNLSIWGHAEASGE